MSSIGISNSTTNINVDINSKQSKVASKDIDKEDKNVSITKDSVSIKTAKNNDISSNLPFIFKEDSSQLQTGESTDAPKIEDDNNSECACGAIPPNFPNPKPPVEPKPTAPEPKPYPGDQDHPIP